MPTFLQQYGNHDQMWRAIRRDCGQFIRCHHLDRPYDTIVRWGGEEFIILLRATDEPAAIHFSERIRLGIQKELDPDLPFSMTISIGLAQYQDNDTLEALVERADQTLYYAKQTGRNRVMPWSMLTPESNV